MKYTSFPDELKKFETNFQDSGHKKNRKSQGMKERLEEAHRINTLPDDHHIHTAKSREINDHDAVRLDLEDDEQSDRSDSFIILNDIRSEYGRSKTLNLQLSSRLVPNSEMHMNEFNQIKEVDGPFEVDNFANHTEKENQDQN